MVISKRDSLILSSAMQAMKKRHSFVANVLELHFLCIRLSNVVIAVHPRADALHVIMQGLNLVIDFTVDAIAPVCKTISQRGAKLHMKFSFECISVSRQSSSKWSARFCISRVNKHKLAVPVAFLVGIWRLCNKPQSLHGLCNDQSFPRANWCTMYHRVSLR